MTAIAALACLLPACREPSPEDAAAHDLVALMDLARERRETTLIDLGTPAAREFLEEGWSWDEAEETTFVWGVGWRSRVRFLLTAARDLPVVLRGAAPVGPSGEPQRVGVTVNGHQLGKLRLGPSFEEHRLAVPGSALRAGWNRLELRYAYRSAGPKIRQFAARWDLIRFGEGATAGERVRADPGARTLFLPFGTELEYYLRLPASSSLVLAELAAIGAADEAVLEVLLEPEGGAEAALTTLRPGHDLRVELGDTAPGVARLTLRAVAGGQAGGLTLRRPRIDPAIGGDAGPRQPRPNVVVYLIDALRADRVGAYGGAAGMTPNIDELAAEALVYRDAIAQSSWTKPAVTSLFTGLLPSAHGVLLREHALSSRATTLAEVLLAAGYRTAAFSTNPFVSRAFGLDQGFVDFVYLDVGRTGTHHAFSDRVNDEVLSWLDAHGAEPFFLYVHTVDPHAPYTPPRADGSLVRGEEPVPVPSCREQQPLAEDTRREMVARYDEEVAFNDASFGRLMEELRRRELYDDSLVVLLSDHGEAFWEHRGWRHENFLYSEVIDIPLIVKPPRGEDREATAGLAQQIDVLPTVLDSLRLPVPRPVQGRSLLRGAREAAPAPRPGFADLQCPSGRRLEAVLAGPWKLIRTVDRQGTVQRLELYHRGRDPGETSDAAADEAVVVERLLRLLDARARRQALTPDRAEVDAELQETLGALGYVD